MQVSAASRTRVGGSEGDRRAASPETVGAWNVSSSMCRASHVVLAIASTGSSHRRARRVHDRSRGARASERASARRCRRGARRATSSRTWAGSSRSQRPGVPISERMPRARYSAARSMSTPGAQPAGVAPPARGTACRKSAMNGSDFADSVVSSGSSRSGSVSRILRSTSCSAPTRCANTSPSREQLGEVGRVAHVVGELGEVVGRAPSRPSRAAARRGRPGTGGRSWPGRRPTPSRRRRSSSWPGRSARRTCRSPRAGGRAGSADRRRSCLGMFAPEPPQRVGIGANSRLTP